MSDSNAPKDITLKIKAGTERAITLTVSDNITVSDLKTKLSTHDRINVPVERQRLIYSGRVMKNDDVLSTYKIKEGNTIHVVKSAASNAAQPARSGSSAAASAVPTNIAAGSASDPLTHLTGARYAGHLNLPSASMFGADGGMGAPPNEDELSRMLDDPAVQQTLTAALDNPAFIDQMIRMNPQLASIPGIREMFRSPIMRHFLTNPELMRASAQLSRQMSSGGNSFPAPGATDSTAAGSSPASGDDSTGTEDPFAGVDRITSMVPFILGYQPGAGSGAAGAGAASANPADNPFMALFNQAAAPSSTSQAATGRTPGADATPTSNNTTTATAGTNSNAAPNPFGFPGMEAFTNPEAINEVMNMLRQGELGNFPFPGMGGGAAAATPADSRPPEERYAEQLRQLNDMGFFDFDQNISALRRSGGSVQGAIEHLLGSM